ncbi:hypothetical protein [Chryseobacterium indologenes]|uniref:Uncharacterized protein n=1 Tax=Chryseobacterium indologenes TaxID=253 RepID=A0A0N1KSK7_CHRID|nr:hypothetical protein [Chryseobacterium indologenes]KPE51245.1 hypothetical protein AOB46_11305 [Chryseobacterium indologenes]
MKTVANTDKMFMIEVTNIAMPQADDANFDVEGVIHERKFFETEKEAKKYFNKIVKENDMRVIRNMARGNHKELYLTPVQPSYAEKFK